MVKAPFADKLISQKNVWNAEDDEKMFPCASKHRTGNRTSLLKQSGLRRSGKSSRQRWNGDQKQDPKHKSFTPQEEELVIKLHAAIGSRWPIIAQQLPGRTDNDVKILWNSKLRKKLSAMGIDPVTHKPFSQILADYGNIGAFPEAGTRFSSLSRDLKNASMLKPDQSSLCPQTFPNSENFSTPNTSFAQIELPAQHSLNLYSQLQAITLVTESSNYTNTENMTPYYMTECASSSESPSSMVNQEISSFSWSDFLLEDACLQPANAEETEHRGALLQFDANTEANQNSGAVQDMKSDGILVDGFEASSSSNSSFVETMLEHQDEMLAQFPGFYEEPFYY